MIYIYKISETSETDVGMDSKWIILRCVWSFSSGSEWNVSVPIYY